MKLFALMSIVLSLVIFSLPNSAHAQTIRSHALELAAEIEDLSKELRSVQFAPTKSIRNKPADETPYEIQVAFLEKKILKAAAELDEEKEFLNSIGRGRRIPMSDGFLAVRELRALPYKVRSERSMLLKAWKKKELRGRRAGLVKDEEGNVTSYKLPKTKKDVLKKLSKNLNKYGSISTGRAGTRFGNIEVPDEEVGAWEEEVDGEFTCASLF